MILSREVVGATWGSGSTPHSSEEEEEEEEEEEGDSSSGVSEAGGDGPGILDSTRESLEPGYSATVLGQSHTPSYNLP